MSNNDYRGDSKSGEELSKAISAYRDLVGIDSNNTVDANEVGVELPMDLILKQIPDVYVDKTARSELDRIVFVGIPDLVAQLRKGRVTLPLSLLAGCLPATALKAEAFDDTTTLVTLPLSDVVKAVDPALLRSGAQSKDVGGKYNLASLRDPFKRASTPEEGGPPPAPVPIQQPATVVAPPEPPPPPPVPVFDKAPVAPVVPAAAPPPPPPVVPVVQVPVVEPVPVPAAPPTPVVAPIAVAPTVNPAPASPVLSVTTPDVTPVLQPTPAKVVASAPVPPSQAAIVAAPAPLAAAETKPAPVHEPKVLPTPVPPAEAQPTVSVSTPVKPHVTQMKHDASPPIRTPTFTGDQIPDYDAAPLPPDDVVETGALGSVNANTADVDQLLAIPGVDHELANKIVGDRLQHGRFSSIFDMHERVNLSRATFLRITGMPYSSQKKHRALKLARKLAMAPAGICDLNSIAEAVAKTKGISGCVICDKEGLIVAEYSVGQAAEALSAIAADLIAHSSQNMSMVGLTSMSSLSVSIGGQMFTIAKSGELYLTVVHDANRITGSKLKLIHLTAQEMEWAFSRRVFAG